MFCKKFRAVTKRSQMHPNTSKRTETLVLGPMGWIGSLRNNPTWLRGTNFCINCTSSPHFAPSFMQLRYDRKSKYYETHQNMNLGSSGMDQVCLLRKITTWLRVTNFCINCTSSPRLPPSFMLLWNNPKCTQTLCNAPKHDFRVQRRGSSAFIAKNCNVTSWHKHLH